MAAVAAGGGMEEGAARGEAVDGDVEETAYGHTEEEEQRQDV